MYGINKRSVEVEENKPRGTTTKEKLRMVKSGKENEISKDVTKVSEHVIQ